MINTFYIIICLHSLNTGVTKIIYFPETFEIRLGEKPCFKAVYPSKVAPWFNGMRGCGARVLKEGCQCIHKVENEFAPHHLSD